MSATRNASIVWRRAFREASGIGKRASPEVAISIQQFNTNNRNFDLLFAQLCATNVQITMLLSPQVSLCAFNTLVAQALCSPRLTT
jgi:hypothetical protein